MGGIGQHSPPQSCLGSAQRRQVQSCEDPKEEVIVPAWEVREGQELGTRALSKRVQEGRLLQPQGRACTEAPDKVTMKNPLLLSLALKSSFMEHSFQFYLLSPCF